MMLMKQYRTGRGSALAVLLLCALTGWSATASAKGQKKKKDAAPEHKAGLMEDGGKDPAATETLDEDGQFIPGKKKKPLAGAGAGAGEGEANEAEEGSDASATETETETKAKAPPPPPEKKPPHPPRKTVGFFAEMLIGFGRAPEPGPNDANTGTATSFGFLVGGHYDLSTDFRLMLRLPYTLGTILSEENASKSASALGVPEISARYRLTDPGDSEWALRLAVGVPVAQGNPDPTNNKDAGGWEAARVQRVADAANGWHDQELYAPKRLPISPALLFSYRDEKLRLGSELKAVFMPKIGGSIAQPAAPNGGGSTEMNALAVTALLGGSASYEVFSRKFLALSAWATYQITPAVDFKSSATSPSPFQFVLEPKILAQFGHFVPSVGFLFPVGGQLGGKINGVRIHVDAVF